jgi:hypothetical protein
MIGFAKTCPSQRAACRVVGRLAAGVVARCLAWAVIAWISRSVAAEDNANAQGRKSAEGRATQFRDDARNFLSFRPLARPEPPAPSGAGGLAWCRTPIDRFVLAKLESKGIGPNRIADRLKLIRRAYFDLLGLPPTPEQVEAFVSDPAPDAYERLIDRLLDDAHFGERWARHWLDAARFAESHGFEQDYDRPHAYHFRDFVIRAFNQDMPYDQFVRWQLAGDELEPDNPQAMMATGFLGAGVFPTQITANEVERTRYDALDDMAATMGTAMLGLTIGCARCHDHKYDPISTHEYYRLVSTFTTTVRSEIELDLEPEIYRAAKEQFDREHAPLAGALAKFETDQLPARFEQWMKEQISPATPHPQPLFPERRGERTIPKWIVLDLVEYRSEGGAKFAKLDDGSLLAGGTNPKFDTYTFVAHTNLQGITAVRLEALAHESFAKSGPGRAANGNFALTDFKLTIAPLSPPGRGAGGEGKSNAGSPTAAAPPQPVAVKLAHPKATFEQNGLPIAATIDADAKSAWAVDPQVGKDHAAAFQIEGDAACDGGSVLTFTLKFENNDGHNIGRPRLSISTAPPPAGLEGDAGPQNLAEIAATLAGTAAAEKLTEQQRATLLKWYRTLDTEWQKLNGVVQEHLQKQPRPKLTKVMVASEGFKPIRHHTQGADFFEQTYFLDRGDTNRKGDVATQSFLSVLMADPAGHRWHESPPPGWRTSYRRRALANWITDTEYGAGNLLARVIVNRLWHHHVGRGIVATPNDFGTQGERPTHPELLDWLAGELMRNGWRLKPMHKLIMTSAVYMQGSQFDPAKNDADPGNQLCWRRTPRRLEAEVIRDAMLAVSGSLDPHMFGPGTLEESHNRRSIYFMVKRSKLIPTMQLFDAPEPLVSVGNRPSTTIAPQALLFMNNPNVRRYAVNFARRLEPGGAAELSDAIRRGYLTALGRAPTDAELDDSVVFVHRQIESYSADGKASARELALADFCQVLMSLNEFVYVQ